MDGTAPLLVVAALATSVALGLIAHEWAHALTLHAFGVGYDVEFFPDRSGGLLGLVTSCPWAHVRPRPLGTEPPWTLRLAAMAPLAMTLPVVAVAATVGVPGADAPVATALLLGWLGCAIPSPQDFSVAFYADRLLSEAGDHTPPEPPTDDPNAV